MLSLQVSGIQVLMHLGTTPGQDPPPGVDPGVEPGVVEPPGVEVCTGETEVSEGEEPPVGTAMPVSVAVTGQMVVDRAMVLVMTLCELAGQLVTVGAQLVTVTSVVVHTVEVVQLCGVTEGEGGTTAVELTAGAGLVGPVPAGMDTENEPEGTETEKEGTDGVLVGTETAGTVTETSGIEIAGRVTEVSGIETEGIVTETSGIETDGTETDGTETAGTVTEAGGIVNELPGILVCPWFPSPGVQSKPIE